MHSPVRALIWQQWRHIRWPLLLACLVVASTAVFDWAKGGQGFSLVVFFPTVVILTLFMLVSQGDLNDLHVSFPSRLFTLPLRTHVLVNCVLFFRLLAIGLLACVTLGIYYLLFGRIDEVVREVGVMPFFLIPMLLPACVQAILWWPGWPVPIRLMVVLAAFAGISMIGGRIHPGSRPLFAVVVLFVAYGMAQIGVALDRRGMSAPVAKWLLARIWQPAGRLMPFKSSTHALLWYEWKTRGRILPILAVSFLVFWVAAFWVEVSVTSGYIDPQVRSHSILLALVPIFALLPCPLLAVLTMGILLPGISHKERVSGISTFTMTRPLSTRILAAARLRTGAISIGIMYILMALISSTASGTWISIAESQELIPAEIHDLPLSALIIVVCLLIAHLAVCWTILWLGPMLLGAYVLLGSFVASIAVLSEHFFPSVFMHPFFEHPFFEHGHILWLPAVGLVLLAVWPFYAAYRRGLLAARTLWVMAAAWPVISIGLVAYGVAVEAPIGPGERWVVPGIAAAAALALIPLLPLATVPLTMAWFRHR